MNENILIVDDEKEIADLIEVYLKNDGYTVHKFYNGTDALKCIESQNLDLVILDVMLPDVDGFRICQKIREQYFYPIIMLTAKVEDTDKIMGLTIGADDYITKPFNPLEVVARVKTQLRRYYSYEGTNIKVFAELFNNNVCVKVINEGNTIPKEKLDRIFEQFFRLDTARNSSSGGAGLGLAIAKEIVELHHGTITADSANFLFGNSSDGQTDKKNTRTD